jgi:hypothetical protein
MEYTYEMVESLTDKMLKRTDANGKEVWIPLDESNSDYQRYLNPDAEQSTPILSDK